MDQRFEKFRAILEDGAPDSKKINMELAQIKDKKEKEEVVKYLQMYYQLDLTEKQAKVMRPLSDKEKEERVSADMQICEEISEIPLGQLFKCVEFVVFIYVLFFALQMYGLT